MQYEFSKQRDEKSGGFASLAVHRLPPRTSSQRDEGLFCFVATEIVFFVVLIPRLWNGRRYACHLAPVRLWPACDTLPRALERSALFFASFAHLSSPRPSRFPPAAAD